MYMSVLCLHASKCITTLVPGVQGVQNRLLNPLEQGLHRIVSHYVGDGKQAHACCKSIKCS